MKASPYRLLTIAFVLSACIAAHKVAATVRYVNVANGSPAPPYTNWATAATVIQDAIDASGPGDFIWVTNGTYNTGGRPVVGGLPNRVAVDRPVTLASVNGPQFTTIQGSGGFYVNPVRCVYLTNGAVLSGFTLHGGSTTNGGADGPFLDQIGGGVLCASSSAVLSNCTITANQAAVEGGGSYDGTLNNCSLNGNSATWGGGAFDATLNNCSISGNTAQDPGGTREGDGGGSNGGNLTNCIVIGNHARVTGGGAASATLVNCLIEQNSALEGGGAGYSTCINCTIVGNSAPTDGGVGGGLGGGLLNGSALNSILVSNSATFGGFGQFNAYGSAISYSCLWPDLPSGTSNIVADPLFVNYTAGDYHLQAGSPCIDAGTNVFDPGAVDLDGAPRVVDGIVDMGAYEYQHAVFLLSNPSNQSVVLTSNIVLSVSALGDAPLAYEWLFNGAPLVDGGRVLGAGSNLLTIADAQTNDAGNYWVVVSNSSGSVTSLTAAINILIPVTITAQPTNKTVIAGSNATFTVGATGIATLGYQWYSNGITLVNGGRISGANAATLTISTTQTNDSGAAYQMVVTNSYGAATSAVATLTVLTRAQITGQPASEAVLLGGNVTFSITATGSALGYQWFLDGAPLSDGGRFSGSATPVLTISNVQSGDAGGYAAVASNLVSSAKSLTASLTPQAVPSPSTRYVALTSANPTPPYLDWSTAATNIQDAIDASVAGDFVLVSNGIYNAGGGRVVYGTTTNRVVITKPIAVQSVNGPAVTTIAGFYNLGAAHPGGRCVYLTNNTFLSGFTLLTGGTGESGSVVSNQSGGGVWCESPSATISNCVFNGNFAQQYGGGAFGGTLMNCVLSNNSAIYGGAATSNVLSGCTLINNFASYQNTTFGGGAYGCTLSNCLVVGNHVRFDTLNGGGAAFSTLTSCVVSNNGADNGGGTYMCFVNSSLISSNRASNGGGVFSNTVNNCVIQSNSAGNGGGAYYSSLINCTIANNSATGNFLEGGGMFGGSALNCIIYDNIGAHLVANFYFPSNGVMSYCCTSPMPTNGVANITNDPAFVNLAGQDFHLQSSSLCINSGNKAYVTGSTDFDGNPRIAGGTVDIGAYEYQTPGSVISYAWLQQYGLPTDGSVDYTDLDGTGFNVYQDWIAGLNPTNSASVLAMETPVAGTNSPGVTVSWLSVSNRTYYLQQATNLAAQPAFSTIQSNIAGQMGMTSITDTTATNGGPYFYRVGIQQ